MIDPEVFSVASRNVMKEGFRSILTLLGIVIGIGAIVSLIALGQGLENTIEEMFVEMGLESVYVIPGTMEAQMMPMGGIPELTESDMDRIEALPNVEFVSVFYASQAVMTYGKDSRLVSLIAFDPDKAEFIEEMGEFQIASGRQLSSKDTHAVLLSEDFAEEGFEKEIKVRDYLYLDGIRFRVIGLIKKGIYTSAYMNMFMVNTKTLDVLGKEGQITEVIVRVSSKDVVEKVKQDIEGVLGKYHEEGEYTVMTMDEVLEMTMTVLAIVRYVLVGIAAISLVVGGIGIMNTMLMAIIERRREIGVMKAIGATRKKIISIFIVEAGLIGLGGGVLGLGLAYLIGKGVEALAASYYLEFSVYYSPFVVLGALAFAMLIGMASGAYPAFKAANLDPVEALRYE